MKQPYPRVILGQYSVVFNFLSLMSTLVSNTVKGIQYSLVNGRELWNIVLHMQERSHFLLRIFSELVLLTPSYQQKYSANLRLCFRYMSHWQTRLAPPNDLHKTAALKRSVKAVEVPGKRRDTVCKACFRKIKKCMYLHNQRSRHSS